MKAEELKKLSKKELIELIRMRELTIKKQISTTNNKIVQIRHFRKRIKKIRDSLDYLLKHPYSDDTGFTTHKHQRDITNNQPSKLKKKTK